MEEPPAISLSYEFGDAEIYTNYVVFTMKEGIVVKPEYNDVLVKLADTYFTDRPFGYVTHRKNSYAVDPRIYIETSKIKNLVAFAVIAPMANSISTTDFEKKFIEKPFQVFRDIGTAINWVENLIATA